MKKQTIVIASILKPVDDTRMFEKMAQSLAATGRYQVVVIGRSGTTTPTPSIHQIGLGLFSRISWARWTASFQVAQQVWHLQPHLWIVATHELLMAAIWLRWLRGIPFVYDIRENYYRNIRYSNAFPLPLRGLIATYVRIKERLIVPWAQHVFLAESGYAREMPFFQNATVIENKSTITDTPNGKPHGKRLLFSGTLAESTGVMEAIAWSKALHELDDSVTLHIIGHAAQKTTLQRIREAIKGFHFITLEGGTTLVVHTRVAEAIRHADFGWVTYPISPMTENAMPTKLYEYLACQLPILLINHPPWTKKCNAHAAALVIDVPFDAARVLERMNTSMFYTSPVTDATWASEVPKLIQAVEGILRHTSLPGHH